MGKRKKEQNESNLLLETDWLLKEPIDFEHKKYLLLSYFQKIDKFLEENKLYPSFTEISLHLASLQTLIKEGVTLYTDKKFNTLDEELLLKDLMVKPAPKLTIEQVEELEKIVKFAAPKFYDFFSIMKSYWSVYYDSVTFTLRKNKNNIDKGFGFITYTSKDNKRYFWEYEINKFGATENEYNLNFKLIYSEDKKNLTNKQILSNFSNWNEEKINKSPVFCMKTTAEYPINETLLPIFKRKVISYIMQTFRIKDLKTNENGV